MADPVNAPPAAPVAAVETPTPAPVAAPAETLTPFQQAVAAIKAKMVEDTKEAEAQEAPAPDVAPVPATLGESPPEPPKVDPFAPKFEALSKQERALREERKALAAERAKMEAEFAPFRKAAELTKAGKHLSAMKASGIDYQKVVEGLVGGEKDAEAPPAIHPEVEKLRGLVEQMQQREQAALVDSYRAKVDAAALKAGDKYELVLARGPTATQSVLDAIGAYYRENNEFPGGSEEAAIEIGLGHVEAALEAEYAPMLKTKKFSSRLSPVAPKEEVPRPQGIGQAQSAAARTLTNSLAASPPRAAQPQTQAERLAEAARIISGAQAGP